MFIHDGIYMRLMFASNRCVLTFLSCNSVW